MKHSRALVLLAFVLASFSFYETKTVTAATVSYVDVKLSADCTSGNYSIANRSCQGTDGNAYHSVNGALGAIADGDTLLVRDGTYREHQIGGEVARNSAFPIGKSVTIKGYQNETAVLTYDPTNLPREGTDKGPIINIGAPNVTLENLTIIGTRSLGDNVREDTDINIWVNAPNVIIRNDKIYDAGHAGVKGGSGTFIIENNEFANIGFTQRDQGIYTGDSGPGTRIIRFNDFHNVTGFGIQIYGYGKNYEVYGNIIHDNGEGGMVVTGDHITIVNNVIYGNGKTSVSPWGGQGGINFFHYGLFNFTIKNNIIWGNVSADIVCAVDSDQGGNVFANNLIGTGVDACNKPGNFWGKYAKNTISGDPQFVILAPATWADFRLKSTSPAIGKGVNAGSTYQQGLNSTVSGWFPGLMPRSANGWDIGPFVSQPGQ